MTYCKNYCEEKGISTSQLSEAQKCLYHIAENMRMDKSISKEGYEYFQQAIKALEQEPFINKPCVSEKACEHDKQMVLDKIKAEIERQEKWLLQAGCTAYNVDIAFDAIKSAVGRNDKE